MEGNEGLFDRIVRGVAGTIMLGLAGASFAGPVAVVEGLLAMIFAIGGGLLLLTGLVGWCPAYAMLGLRTCGPRESRR
jgi:hypothetical protein